MISFEMKRKTTKQSHKPRHIKCELYIIYNGCICIHDAHQNYLFLMNGIVMVWQYDGDYSIELKSICNKNWFMFTNKLTENTKTVDRFDC